VSEPWDRELSSEPYADYPEVSELGSGRGDTVTDAQLAAPLPPDDEGGPTQRRED